MKKVLTIMAAIACLSACTNPAVRTGANLGAQIGCAFLPFGGSVACSQIALPLANAAYDEAIAQKATTTAAPQQIIYVDAAGVALNPQPTAAQVAQWQAAAQ